MSVASSIRRAIASGESIDSILSSLTDVECQALIYDWRAWARPVERGAEKLNGRETWTGQLPPPVPWDVWLLLAGRGYGKTRTAAEWVRDEARKQPVRFAIVGQDPTDARLVMILGESGIMSVTPERERPTYNPSTKLLNWPNGSVAEIHSGHDFESLRGPQFHRAWIDELCAMRYARQTWDNLAFGMRLVAPDGTQPKTVVTTTPKPIALLSEIVADSGTAITVGTTFENVDNLSPTFMKRVVRRYEGTSLGAQELHARLLDEVKGALWTREGLDRCRVAKAPDDIRRVVVAVDPMARASENARRKVAPPETGIVVAALAEDGCCYIVDDVSQSNAKPDVWGRAVIDAFQRWKADRVIGEVNNGGDMVEDVLRTRAPTIAYRAVTASRGKRVRAEPVSALYEQGRVRHVGLFGRLEDQLCTWSGEDGEPSPDRLDALVWAVTELMLGVSEAADIAYDAAIGRGSNDWRNA